MDTQVKKAKQHNKQMFAVWKRKQPKSKLVEMLKKIGIIKYLYKHDKNKSYK